jgi:hypothetical protein
MPMRRLQQILTGESVLAELLKRRQHELALEERVKQVLPPTLAAHVAVADGRSPELVLAAASGAAAALVRQRVPDVLRALAHEGWQFTGIRVRVQARPAPRSSANIVTKQIDVAAAAKLRAVAAALGDTGLSAALTRLAARAGTPALDAAEGASDRVKGKDGKQ